MKRQDVKRVRLTDKMVLIGLGLAAVYWFLDTFIYIFMSYDVRFFHGFFGFKLSDIWTRIIVCCLFVIFGSHAQFTINTRKVIEEEIRKREQRYRTIIENTEDGYYEVDLDGKLHFFNNSISQISGYAKEELLEMDIRELLDEKSRRRVSDSFDHIQRTGATVKDAEWTLIRKNGEKRFVESSISVIKDAKGQPTGFKGFLRDVTKRRRAEALRQEKLAAEAASKSKSEFLANMSHEIRTPLNAIIGLVELLMGTPLNADQKEDLSVINSAAHSLLALINDILDFSKIEAGKLALDSVGFPIRSFIGESLRIMGSKAHEKNIELAFRVAPQVPEPVTGDPTRLRQILLNLVGNAIKFTETGEIIVNVELEEETDADVMLHFAVKDTGIGIPEDKHQSIFRTFEQADGSTSRRFGGTGLGLAVSSQLVSLMGGRIWVDSQPGQGSTFHFTARFTTSDTEECKDDSGAVVQLQGNRILVVDDNTSSQHILRELLTNWGMSVVTVSGSDEARKRLWEAKNRGAAFKLALIDTDMPDPDGIFLAQWTTAQEDLDVKLIMMLSSSSLASRPLLQDLGIRAFVHKPVSPPDLLTAIMIALDRISSPPDVPEKPSGELTLEASRPLHILVAEDTPFNQKFITRLLQRWGHTSVIAENGIQALKILDRESFDLILMDVQMPEVDGFEATRTIREREKQTGGHIPIIAMTAHAMKGDKERCIDAGMDDYVSKPISSEILQKAIQHLTSQDNRRDAVSHRETKAAESDDQAPSFDKEALLATFEHDWNFLQETVNMLLEDYPPMLEKIRKALQSGDAADLRRTAHALKGMVGNFQAKTAAQAAFKLEEMGRQKELSDAEQAYDALVNEMDRFKQSICKMLEEEKP